MTDNKNFIVDADFSFKSSVIVRDYDFDEEKISAVSMKSLEDFVIQGTSLKEIFRHRAEYIFSKLNFDKNLLNELMGTAENEKIKSRFVVAESYISDGVEEVAHTRNKIDSFTGGTLQGTLFTTKPIYQKNSPAPVLNIKFEIINAKNFEVGLALFKAFRQKSISKEQLTNSAATAKLSKAMWRNFQNLPCRLKIGVTINERIGVGKRNSFENL